MKRTNTLEKMIRKDAIEQLSKRMNNYLLPYLEQIRSMEGAGEIPKGTYRKLDNKASALHLEIINLVQEKRQDKAVEDFYELVKQNPSFLSK